MIGSFVGTTGSPGPAGAAGPTGATGPQGPAGSVSSNFESVLLGLAPTRCYRLSNPGNGNTETDLGSDAQNGTWGASGASQVAGMVLGNANKATLFDGVAGNLSIPTTNLPTGAGVYTIGMLFFECSRAAGAQTAWSIGAYAVNQQASALDWITASLRVNGISGQLTSPWQAMAPTPGALLVMVVYDGTTYHLFVGGHEVGNAAFTNNLTYGLARIGADSGASAGHFGNFVGQYWFLFKSVLSGSNMYKLVTALAGN